MTVDGGPGMSMLTVRVKARAKRLTVRVRARAKRLPVKPLLLRVKARVAVESKL